MKLTNFLLLAVIAIACRSSKKPSGAEPVEPNPPPPPTPVTQPSKLNSPSPTHESTSTASPAPSEGSWQDQQPPPQRMKFVSGYYIYCDTDREKFYQPEARIDCEILHQEGSPPPQDHLSWSIQTSAKLFSRISQIPEESVVSIYFSTEEQDLWRTITSATLYVTMEKSSPHPQLQLRSTLRELLTIDPPPFDGGTYAPNPRCLSQDELESPRNPSKAIDIPAITSAIDALKEELLDINTMAEAPHCQDLQCDIIKEVVKTNLDVIELCLAPPLSAEKLNPIQIKAHVQSNLEFQMDLEELEGLLWELTGDESAPLKDRQESLKEQITSVLESLN